MVTLPPSTKAALAVRNQPLKFRRGRLRADP
jgi:hypothetical protein